MGTAIPVPTKVYLPLKRYRTRRCINRVSGRSRGRKVCMNKEYDVLGAGIAAVDDLWYVSAFPPVDCKIPVHSSIRQGGGPACTAIAAVGSLGGRAAYAARFGDNDL